MSLFDGVQNFTPALTAQELAIKQGQALSQAFTQSFQAASNSSMKSKMVKPADLGKGYVPENSSMPSSSGGFGYDYFSPERGFSPDTG